MLKVLISINLHLQILRFVGQGFVVAAVPPPPLPQTPLGVIRRRGAFWGLSGGRLAARPLRTNNDHGAPVVSSLVLRRIHHYHALRVLVPQSVQRNH